MTDAWNEPMPRDRAYPKGTIIGTPRPEAFIVARWLAKGLAAKEFDIPTLLSELLPNDGPQHDELTPRGRLVAALHTFGVRDPDLDRIADIATTARGGAAGDWPCSFHVEPTPGCEMCRNVGGSGQRLEMSRGGAPAGDFYEEDEPVADIKAIMEKGPHGVTISPPWTSANATVSVKQSCEQGVHTVKDGRCMYCGLRDDKATS